MNARLRRSASATAVIAVLALFLAANAAATTYNVSNTHDVTAANAATGCATPPASAAGGACTLRSAVQAANAAGGTNTINLAAGTYKLTINPITAGTDDDSAGDLNVTNGALSIHGAGSASTIIDANFLDRAFTVDSQQSLTLTGTTVRNGRAGTLGNVSTCPSQTPTGTDGGAILQHGMLTLTNDVITSNMAPGYGGAVASEGDSLTVSGTTVSNNTVCANSNFAENGGGIFTDGNQLTMDSSIVSGNSAPNAGGGIASEGADMTISTSTISNNTAHTGAGILAAGGEGRASVTLIRDTLANNVAEGAQPSLNPPAPVPAPSMGPGGAIENENDNVSIVNTTITGNTARTGGGIASPSGNTTISFSTITGNTATGTQGATGNLDNEDSGNFTLDDTIVAGGISPSGQPTNCNGPLGFTSAGHNLFDDTSDSGSQCAAVASDLINGSPNLGPLANNGGPTQTEALLLGSPAINTADDALCKRETTAIDERGVMRPQGPHCDIGAYEYQQVDLALTARISPSTISVGQKSTATDTITNNGFSGATGVVFSDPGSAKFTINSATPSQGSCTHTAKTVSCAIGSMAVGAKVTVKIVLTGDSPGQVQLNSSVHGNQPDPDTSNNTAVVRLKVISRTDLALTKKASPTHVSSGQRTTFTLTVLNRGPSTDTGVVLTDKLPGGLKFISAKPSQGKCSGGADLSCKLGTLRSGAKATVKLTVRATRTGTIRNTAHVSGKAKESNLKNNTSSASVFVTCTQNLVFTEHYDQDLGPTQDRDLVHTVKVYVDGKLTQTFHGFDLHRVKIRPVPPTGMHSVTVWFILASGQVVTATRTYNGCSNGPTHYSYPPATGPGAS